MKLVNKRIEQTRKQIGDPAYHHLWDQLGGIVGDNLWEQLEDQEGDPIVDQVGHVGTLIDILVFDQLRDQIRRQIKSQMRRESHV